MADADEELVAREIERHRAAGTDQGIAMAALLADVPTDVAVRFIRDELLRALGGGPRGDYWLRVQELNFLAHRKRRADWRRYAETGARPSWPPGAGKMAVIPDE